MATNNEIINKIMLLLKRKRTDNELNLSGLIVNVPFVGITIKYNHSDLLLHYSYVTGLAKTWLNLARTEIHFIA